MKSVFLNDVAYTDGEQNPLKALDLTLAFSVDDWAATRAMAWVWGIVCGWDDDAMAELAQTFRWDEATTARLNRLHERFAALSAVGSAVPEPANPND